MKSYTAEDTFYIGDVGRIFICRILYQDMPDINEVVLINDNRYEIVAVERLMKLIYPPVPSENVALVVREL